MPTATATSLFAASAGSDGLISAGEVSGLAAVATTGSAASLTTGTLADGRLPQRLQALGQLITNCDTAVENGWYYSAPGPLATLKGPPSSDTLYTKYRVENITSTTSVTQYATVWDGVSATSYTYTRDLLNGAWSSWEKTGLTEAETIALIPGNLPGQLLHGDYLSSPTDSRSLTKFGIYSFGPSAVSYCPDTTSAWQLLHLPWSGSTIDYDIQYARKVAFGTTGPIPTYRRFNHPSIAGNANWSVWEKCDLTEAEVDAKVASGVATTTNASLLTSGTLADARLPSRLGPYAPVITDWDSAVQNGFYYAAAGVANGPPGSATLYTYGFVVVLNGTYATQIAYVLDGATSAATTQTYRRDLSSTFGPWFKCDLSEAEIDAKIAAGGSATTNASLLTSGTLNDARLPVIMTTKTFAKQNTTGEGGEINLQLSDTSILAGNVVIDISGDVVRIFEGGGAYRGVTIPLLSANAGVGTNLLAGSTTNLALGTATTTTQPITNSNGTGITLSAATTTAAGLMTAGEKVIVSNITSGGTIKRVGQRVILYDNTNPAGFFTFTSNGQVYNLPDLTAPAPVAFASNIVGVITSTGGGLFSDSIKLIVQVSVDGGATWGDLAYDSDSDNLIDTATLAISAVGSFSAVGSIFNTPTTASPSFAVAESISRTVVAGTYTALDNVTATISVLISGSATTLSLSASTTIKTRLKSITAGSNPSIKIVRCVGIG
jgi:hypothetical protein